MNSEEYIVIGSGPTGVMAAQTLLEQGKSVSMLDVGITQNADIIETPEKNFLELRKNDTEQYKYFIGEKHESLSNNNIKVGAQQTPSRIYMTAEADKTIPIISDNFAAMESLSLGGLGVGWGLGCYVYSDNELKKVGLDADKMKQAYNVIADRIRISGANSEFRSYTLGHLKNIHPPLKTDNNISILKDLYNKNKDKFDSKRIYFGEPSLALLSEDYAKRKKNSYNDMDFYTDYGNSAWRPNITFQELKKNKNFKYTNNILVISIENIDKYVKINYINLKNKTNGHIICKKLILACGALGTARIILRSMKHKIKRVPILCNPYYYMPCFNIKMLGKPLSYNKTSMAQAMMIYDTDGTQSDIISLALYTYRSLMTFRMLKEVPLGIKDSIKILKLLQSGFVIAGVHHPDSPSSNKYLELREHNKSITGDALYAHYEQNKEEKKKISKHEKTIKKYLKKISCYPIKKIASIAGNSIHYAGTLPFSENINEYGTTHPTGKLNAMKNIYIADGSGFRYLPAKGITLSLMANAHLTALYAIKDE